MIEPRPPVPAPAGANHVALLLLKVNEGEWRDDPKYRCRKCGTAASLHPHTNEIWGCKKCGITTAAVFVFFRHAKPTCVICGHEMNPGPLCPNCGGTKAFD